MARGQGWAEPGQEERHLRFVVAGKLVDVVERVDQ
jgi:hypothetical protein